MVEGRFLLFKEEARLAADLVFFMDGIVAHRIS